MDPNAAVNFLRQAGELKRVSRRGWVLRAVLPSHTEVAAERLSVESVADHSWRVALCGMLMNDASLDKGRMAQLGVVHDVAEAVVGDLTPQCGVAKAEKERLEVAAIASLTSRLPESSSGIKSLWMEYEHRASREARAVKDFDLFEMLLQADEYEERTGVELQEFFDGVEGRIEHEEVRAWEAELRRQREERRRNHQLFHTATP